MVRRRGILAVSSEQKLSPLRDHLTQRTQKRRGGVSQRDGWNGDVVSMTRVPFVESPPFNFRITSMFPGRVRVGGVDTCSSSPCCLLVRQWLLVAVLRALSAHSSVLGSHKWKVKGARESTRFLGVALNRRCMGMDGSTR